MAIPDGRSPPLLTYKNVTSFITRLSFARDVIFIAYLTVRLRVIPSTPAGTVIPLGWPLHVEAPGTCPKTCTAVLAGNWL